MTAVSDARGVSPGDVAAREFSTSRKGYERDEVRAYLRDVAGRIEALEGRLATEAPNRPTETRPLQSLGEVELAHLLGDETARVLVAARAAATERRERIEREAEELLASSRELVAQRLADADALVAERLRAADETAETIVAEAQARAATLDDQVAHELDGARAQGAQIVDEARVVRHRILEDLARRRNAMRRQIEQLLAGRERLLGDYEQVQRTLDDATGDLSRSLDDARLAAEHAGYQFAEAPIAVSDLEEEIVAARIIGHPMVDLTLVAPTTGEVEAVLVESEFAVSPDATRTPFTEFADAVEDEVVEDGVVEDGVVEDVDAVEDDQLTVEEVDDATDFVVDPVDAAVAVGDLDGPVSPTSENPAAPENLDDSERIDVDGLFDAIRSKRSSRVAVALAVIEAVGSNDPVGDETTSLAEPDPADAPHVAIGSRGHDRSAVGAEGLLRDLKRSMSEEQNHVLDLIRRRKGRVDLVELYGDARTHEERIAAALAAHTDHARAGAIAAAMVEMLRRRVGACLVDDEADVARMLDRVRAIYRDVRTNRVADLVSHAA